MFVPLLSCFLQHTVADEDRILPEDIVAEKDKEFVVHTNIARSRTNNRGVRVLIDGVEVESYWLDANDLGSDKSTKGWEVNGVTWSFSFGALDIDEREYWIRGRGAEVPSITDLPPTERERGSFEEQLDELMKACIEVQFCDVHTWTEKVVPVEAPPKVKKAPRVSGARAEAGNAWAAASSSIGTAPVLPTIGDAVNPETKRAAQVKMAVRAGRVISGAVNAPTAAAPDAPSASASARRSSTPLDEQQSNFGEASDDGFPSESEASSREGTPSEYDPSEGASPKKLAKERVKAVRQAFWDFKDGSPVFSARYFYRPQSIVILRSTMADPEDTGAGGGSSSSSSSKTSPSKRKRASVPKSETAASGSESIEQKKKRIEKELCRLGRRNSRLSSRNLSSRKSPATPTKSMSLTMR